MPVSANTILADLQIQHRLQLQRLASHEYQEMLKVLTQLANELAKKTVLIDPTAPGRLRYRNERMAKLMEEGRKSISEKFTEMAKKMGGDMKDLVKLESEYAVNSMSKAAGFSFGRTLTAEQMRAVVNGTYLQGGLLSQWFSRAEQGFTLAFQREIRAGMVAGESIDKMVRRVINSSGDPSLYSKQKRGTEALVRTAVMQTSNEARQATFKANEDVIKGYQWLATLDSATCPECGALDGKVWDLDGNPLDGNPFEFQQPVAHWGCRCVLTTVLKSFREMGIPLDEVPESTRASMDGQVPESTTFSDWFATKDAAFQEKYLGKGRYELYKDGKITFEDLITQRGRPLTLAELREE